MYTYVKQYVNSYAHNNSSSIISISSIHFNTCKAKLPMYTWQNNDINYHHQLAKTKKVKTKKYDANSKNINYLLQNMLAMHGLYTKGHTLELPILLFLC